MRTQPVFISMQFQIFSHPKWESVTKCFLVTHEKQKESVLLCDTHLKRTGSLFLSFNTLLSLHIH